VWYVEFSVTDILIQSVSPDNWRLSSLLTHSASRGFRWNRHCLSTRKILQIERETKI
jgi:hypothetical protein